MKKIAYTILFFGIVAAIIVANGQSLMPGMHISKYNGSFGYRYSWTALFMGHISPMVHAASCGKGTKQGSGGDNIPPTGTIADPMNGSHVSGVTQVMGTASDNVAVQSVQISFDGGDTYDFATGTSTWTYSWDTMVYENGPITAMAKIIDTSNNSSTASVGVTISN